ncbi:MAG: radical SAM protein [Cuniculiplasma sp.]
MDQNYIPDLFFIELTKACDYKCIHCRASSIEKFGDDEMRRPMIKSVLENISQSFPRKPHIVFTGGNPLMHPDFNGIMADATHLDLNFSVSMSAGDKLNPETLFSMEENGVKSISLSIDGSPSTHDHIRNMKGSFRKTVEIASMIRAEDLKLQINTTIMRRNMMELPFVLYTLNKLGIRTWELFFLIKTGRGANEEPISSIDSEEVLKYLYLLKLGGYSIRTVEAPEIKRIEAQVIEEGRVEGGEIFRELVKETRRLCGLDLMSLEIPSRKQNSRKTRTLFLSSTGNVYVSGLFDLKLGNVKINKIGDIVKDSDVLGNLLDPKNLVGKCSNCEFNLDCGGSRARAYHETGNYLESDPMCLYIPVRQKNAFNKTINSY